MKRGWHRPLTACLLAIGAWLWLGARVAYLPLYAFGVRYLRSLAFIVSAVGLLLILRPALGLLFQAPQ